MSRFEQVRGDLRRRIHEAEEKQDRAAEDAVRALAIGNVNGFEAACRIGRGQGAQIDWYEQTLDAVARVEAEEQQAAEQEASKRSMLLEGLRADTVEGNTLRDLAERVIRNLSWKHPRHGTQLYGAELGRHLRARDVQLDQMDREILLAAQKTKHRIGATAHETRELLGGIEGTL